MRNSLILTTIILFVLLLGAILAALMVPDVVRGSLTVVLWTLAAALPLLFVTFLGYFAVSAAERILLRRAERHNLEHEAAMRFLTAPGTDQAWLHRADGTVQNLSLDARWLIHSAAAPTLDEMRQWLFYRHSLRAALADRDLPMLESPDQPTLDILTALRRTPRALIVGATDAGKSTVLCWLAEHARADGRVVVIDPHSAPDKWPEGCTVIGLGSRHDLIEKALDELVQLMVRRYKEIGRGQIAEGGHARITVIVDEWMAIAEQCANAKITLIRLLTESRKAAFAVYIGSHSDRVRSLGLDGRGDLRRGFEIYHLEINQHSGQRSAWLELDGQRTPLALPGAYHPRSNGRQWTEEPAPALEPLRTLEQAGPDGALIPEPGSDEAQVCQMHLQGASFREITEAVWGQHGSHYNDKVRAILEAYDLETEGEK